MQGKSDAATHDEYIERLPEPRRGEIRALHELIRRTAPQLEPTMEFGILGYGKYHYRYATGREGDWMLVGVASNKNYISLYVMATTDDGRMLADTYKDRLPKASIGKSCIRFKRLGDVDRDELASLLREAQQRGVPTPRVIYLGGYSSRGGPGIGVAALRDGRLTLQATVDCPDDPTFLAVAPDRRTLYAAHELDDGLLSAFAVGDGGRLRALGTQPSGGAQPIHLSVHPSGRHLLCANWGTGSIAVHPIGADGALGPATDVVDYPKPYAHMVVADPAGRWVLAVHYALGAVFTYHLDLESGRLRQQDEARLHDGAGPRHLAFHPGGGAVYVVNEADSTVTACAYDPERGRLEPGETVRTVPPDTPVENYPSAVLVSPDGRFVYVANRFHDSVAVLATGPPLRLAATFPCGGAFPRDMALADDGRLLLVANERSDLVAGLAVDPDGTLRPAPWSLPIPAPTCVLPV